MRTNPAGRARSGFTIIELMIVVGIILILMGLTVPLVGNLQRKAKETECANNMRQWMAAMQSYADDNKGLLPTDGTGSGPDAEAGAWYEVLPPYMGETKFSEQKAKNDVPIPAGGRSVFICPAHTPTAALTAGANSTYSYSYGMNYWVNAAKDAEEFAHSTRMRLSQIRRNGEVFVVFAETEDSAMKTVTLNPQGGSVSKPAFRHGNNTVCGFADGHVAAAPMQVVAKYQWNPQFEPGYETPPEPEPAP